MKNKSSKKPESSSAKTEVDAQKESEFDQDFSTESTEESLILVNRRDNPMRKRTGILSPDWWEEWEKDQKNGIWQEKI